MHPRHLPLPALGLVCVGLLVPSLARAQAAGGNESISAAVANPERYLYENGVCPTCAATDVTSSPRPQDMNPEGVSYTDCEQLTSTR